MSSAETQDEDTQSSSCAAAAAAAEVASPPDSKDDGLLVGTMKLLKESSNVMEPTTRVNDPVPTPSIYEDGRGEIHNILAGNKKRINILFTKRGVMRSGDVHVNTQHDFVFEGHVEVWTLDNDGRTTKKMYGPREYICIPPLIPHIFYFLQDTTMAEWWEPEPFQAWFYEPYRKLVDESFTSVANDSLVQKGRLVKLVPEGTHEHEKNNSYWSSIVLTAVLGLVVGIMVGRRK